MSQTVCRICFEEEQEDRVLISPCKCSGSSKYVHYDCLETWRNTTTNEEAKKKCMECNASYIIVNKFPLETITINFDKNIVARNFFAQYLVSASVILCIFSLDWFLKKPSVKLLEMIQTTNITYYLENSNSHTFIYYNSLGSSLVYFLFNILFFIVMMVCVHQRCKYLKVFPICFLNAILSLSWFYFYFIFPYSQNTYFYFILLTPVLNYLFLLMTLTYHNSVLSTLNTNNKPRFLEYPPNTTFNRDFIQISMNPLYDNEIENEPLIQEITEISVRPPVPPPPPPTLGQTNIQHRNNFSNVLCQIQTGKTTLKRRNRSTSEDNEHTMIRLNEHMTRNHRNLQEQVIRELRKSFDNINSQK
jgi:hypothetical protein